MKPYDKVSSFRGANAIFQGQQRIKTQRRENTEVKREQREHKADHSREIKGATRDADQRRSKDQSRGTRTAPRHKVRGS
jgi:hypothetical protein